MTLVMRAGYFVSIARRRGGSHTDAMPDVDVYLKPEILPPTNYTTAPGDPDTAEAALALLPTRLVRKTGVEVVGNWVIDRDLAVVRRRYWGQTGGLTQEIPEP